MSDDKIDKLKIALSEQIQRLEYQMHCDAMSDDFYYTNGKLARAAARLNNLKEQLKALDK